MESRGVIVSLTLMFPFLYSTFFTKFILVRGPGFKAKLS